MLRTLGSSCLYLGQAMVYVGLGTLADRCLCLVVPPLLVIFVQLASGALLLQLGSDLRKIK